MQASKPSSSRTQAHFAGPPAMPYGATAPDLRQLADGLSHGARRARHDDRLAGLRRTDVEQAEVRGHAGHAEYVEPLPDGAERQIDRRYVAVRDLLLADLPVELHAGRAGHGVADGEERIVGRGHDADAAGTHHVADADRRDVALALVHPAPHRRIERQGERLDQDPARLRLHDRRRGERPVAARRHAMRTCGETDLMIEEVGERVHAMNDPWSLH